MKCNVCGFDNADNSLFCECCGAQLIKPVSYDSDPLSKGVYNEAQGQNTDDFAQNGNAGGAQYNNVNAGYNNGSDMYGNTRQYGGNTQQYNGNTQQFNNYGYDDDDSDDAWQQERMRRAQARKAERIARQKAENRRIVIIGIVIAAIIAAGGVAAFFGITYFMNKDNTTASSHAASESSKDILSGIFKKGQMGGEETTVTPEPVQPTAQPTQEPAPTVTETPTPTPEPTAEPEVELNARVKPASSVSTAGYSKVSISSAEASSTIVQDGIDNSVRVTYDGDDTTSWQEGVDGDGINEFLTYKFSREYQVRYITFKMGNWRNQDNYTKNNRPKDISVWVGDDCFEVTIPDGMTEYCMELSKDVPCSEVYVQINSVYKGTEYDDTCIAEVGIYGK